MASRILVTGGSGFLGRYLVKRLAAEGYRVVLHDRRNTGATDVVIEGDVAEETLWLDDLHELMKRSRDAGMQSFDQSLFDLYEAGRVGYEDALRNADSVNDLRLNIKLNSKESKNRDPASGIEHLNIV